MFGELIDTLHETTRDHVIACQGVCLHAPCLHSCSRSLLNRRFLFNRLTTTAAVQSPTDTTFIRYLFSRTSIVLHNPFPTTAITDLGTGCDPTRFDQESLPQQKLESIGHLLSHFSYPRHQRLSRVFARPVE